MKIMEHEQPRQRPAPQRQQDADQAWRVLLLREAISASGLTQKELAHAIGINDAHVSRWLHGVRPVPDRWLPSLASLVELSAS